jgi:hypothetical protein
MVKNYSNEELDAEIARHDQELADALAVKRATWERERKEKRAKFLAEHPQYAGIPEAEHPKFAGMAI